MLTYFLNKLEFCYKGQNMDENNGDVKDENKPSPSEDASKKQVQEAGLMWRTASGLYNIGSGAVGIGVGSVKWAASTTYSVGTGVVSAVGGTAVVQKVVSKVIPSAIPKPKKE
ncbi:transmembrane protein 263 isoform X2 [Parasteatoda tepidariorum]|uniref:transmembrane protein 263 isoform X2 n=1 Tax=Parasteatoda tepidariorum TaxID=114398 RepID=UPI00077FC22D|nr:uncharacterized protein LOC107438969 isoform X2 [Parasteatoda tepidariorum]